MSASSTLTNSIIDGLLVCDAISMQTFVAHVAHQFSSCHTHAELEQRKAEYMGKQSPMQALGKKLAELPPLDKKTYGAFLHQLKSALEALLKQHQMRIDDAQLALELQKQALDVTLPAMPRALGSLHPVMQTWQTVEKIFHSMGFCVATAPELEEDWYNFTALNSPMHHPARSMQDTFYVNQLDGQGQHKMLRTHTSPVQIRFAQAHVARYGTENMPDIRMIAPGRTYRVDSDATHSPMFHQVEGLWIGKNISFADLKGMYTHFLQTFFEQDELRVRFRPSYFPFTEPSAEVDISFAGDVPRWLEISGAGQVHPQVLQNMGIDSEQYMGFAFGSGLERLTMIRHNIQDLRVFFDGDVRFLKQFAY